MKNERKPIFDGLYEITANGKLYSTRSGKYLRPNLDRYGYFYYVISIDSIRYTLKAHRLVAQSFIPNPQEKPTVNHRNGIRHDNRVENLEWATYEEQQADPLTTQNRNRIAAKTDYAAMGALRDYGRKKTAVYDGCKLLGLYSSLKQAVEHHPANYSKASECAAGKRNNVGGVRFCYV